MGNGTSQSTSQRESKVNYGHYDDLPGVKIDTGRGSGRALLDGLFCILNLQIGLASEFVGLCLGIVGELLGLTDSLVDLVTDGWCEKGGSGSEKGV